MEVDAQSVRSAKDAAEEDANQLPSSFPPTLPDSPRAIAGMCNTDERSTSLLARNAEIDRLPHDTESQRERCAVMRKNVADESLDHAKPKQRRTKSPERSAG